jgi:membrane-associated phospholipid phosphatase
MTRTAANIAGWPTVALVLLAGLTTAAAQTSDRFNYPATDPQHHLTLTEFVKDLGGNFKALIAVSNIVPALAGGAAIGVSTIPEQDLERHFAPGDVWGNWAAPGKYIGHPLILGGLSAGLFAISRKSEDRRFRAFSYALVNGSIMSAAIVQPSKVAFQRLRPNGEDRHSFPSGHSTDTFMYATVISEHYGWKAAIPAYTVATYVSATRLADRKHHLTDAAAGAGIGYIIGHTVSRPRRSKGAAPPRFFVNAYKLEGGFGGSLRLGL